MGYIYIIKNTINNKVYIGQTSQSLKTRFKGHIRDSKEIDFEKFDYKYKNKLYNAFRKYGEDKFYMELIEECDNDLLNEREIYYIKEYDSYKNGYNSTVGGEGSRFYSFTKDEELSIINMYKEIKSINEIARRLNCSIRPIQEILYKYNVEIVDNSIKIVVYDKYFNPIKVFDSIEDSRQYIMETEMYTSTDIRNYYRLLHKAFENGNIAYGHRWQLVSDIIYEDKIFRTKFDKEAYIEGKEAYQPEGKQYWVVSNSLVNVLGEIIKINKNSKTSILSCKLCGKSITSYSKTGMCNECANKTIKAPGKPLKPSKEELKILLESGLQKKQIAEMYKRTPSTIHSWINSYGLR